MKNLIIALTVLASTQVSAIEMIDCINDKKVSAVIMEARQNGALMYDVMSAVKSTKLKSRVKDAYRSIQHVNSEYKQKSVEKFTDKHLNKCLARIDS